MKYFLLVFFSLSPCSSQLSWLGQLEAKLSENHICVETSGIVRIDGYQIAWKPSKQSARWCTLYPRFFKAKTVAKTYAISSIWQFSVWPASLSICEGSAGLWIDHCDQICLINVINRLPVDAENVRLSTFIKRPFLKCSGSALSNY